MARERKIELMGEKCIVRRRNGRVIVYKEWDQNASFPRFDLSETEASMLSIYLQEMALEDDE